MKSFSKLLRIGAVVTILSLLVAVLPAPALAAEDVELDPESGEIGDRIDVTGDGFHETTTTTEYYVYIFFSPQEADEGDDISDLDTYHRVKSTSTDDNGEIDTYFTVPSRLTTGPDDEDVHGGDYYVYTSYDNGGDDIQTVNEFTVIAAEIALSPTKGTVGTEVDIDGKDFNGREYITVEYDGEEIDIDSGDGETDSSGAFISTILIPESTAGKHTITVTDETGSENEAEFTVEPEMTVDPTKAAPSDKVAVEGTGFGDEVEVSIELDGDEVATGGTDSYGSFKVTLTVPSKSPGTYNLEARDEDRNRDTANFTIAAGIDLSLTSGNVGSKVTINGAGFRPNSTVTITYAPEPDPVATPVADANGKFSATFTVPRSKGGAHVITATDGSSTITATFTMESQAPPIPKPELPLDGVKAKSPVHFDWGDVTDPSGVTYTLQIGNEDFSEIVLEKTGITDSEYTLTKEEKLKSTKQDAPYYWRVRAVDGASNASNWTTPGTFYVGFTFDLSGWVLYVLMAIAGIVLLLIGYLAGRRTSYF